MFEQFKSLHEQAEPLLIGNVWNAQSARACEKLKFKAIATSSAAVAESLGYSDGEEMTFEEYVFVIDRIRKATSLPLSVDLEGGYGNDVLAITENLQRLAKAGVAGVNIEDSKMENVSRAIVDATKFSALLADIVEELKSTSTNIFINVRCDAFLLQLPSAREEALARLKLFEHTGVHGLFFPCITAVEDIRAVVSATKLPVNVMCMPALPDFKALKGIGVKRISMGNFYNKDVYAHFERQLQITLENGSFGHLFA